MAREQSFEHHARIVPAYHVVASAIFITNAFWTAWRLYQQPTWERVIGVALALALLILYYYARRFALTLQDRLIRLEMRVRLDEILPDNLRARVYELSVAQLVALRFAGNTELPALVARVLDERIADGRAIKKMVKDWQADHLRV